MKSSDVGITDSILATQHNDLRADCLSWEVKVSAEKTISAGSVAFTANQTFYRLDTESDAATDDLNTISGGTEGDIIILAPENVARVVTLKDATGNFRLESNSDFDLSSVDRSIMLLKESDGDWKELSRSSLAASGAPSGLIALSTVACPDGWTRFSALDGKFPRGASSYGGSGGASTHSHTLGTVPQHNHDPGSLVTATSSTHTHTFNVGFTMGSNHRHICINNHTTRTKTLTQSAGAHTHTISGTTASDGAGSAPSTASQSHEPSYLEMIFCQAN